MTGTAEERAVGAVNDADAPVVSVVHDYATQRGGAERVALTLARHYGGILGMSAYSPARTFAEFREMQIQVPRLGRLAPIGHRRGTLFAAMPALARKIPVRKNAEVVIASSSGWAHMVDTHLPKIVYCHNPARWLYQPDDFFAGWRPLARGVTQRIVPLLAEADLRAARGAEMYVANSATVAARVKAAYGITARVIHPPMTLGVTAPDEAHDRALVLCVARPRGYKGHGLVEMLARRRPDLRFVVVGAEGDEPVSNIQHVRDISDRELSRLYTRAHCLLALASEDFGLTPVEAHAHGTPVLALRAGGYLETVEEGLNGVFVEAADPDAVADGLQQIRSASWDRTAIRASAERFSVAGFLGAMDECVREVSHGRT
jgi:glycosyltransferase involved in cell wall biosynthesis